LAGSLRGSIATEPGLVGDRRKDTSRNDPARRPMARWFAPGLAIGLAALISGCGGIFSDTPHRPLYQLKPAVNFGAPMRPNCAPAARCAAHRADRARHRPRRAEPRLDVARLFR